MSTCVDHVQLVMGTGVRYALRGVTDHVAAHAALDEAKAWMDRVDRVFSTYRSASAVSRLRLDEEVAVEDQAIVDEVVDRCATAWHLTDGWFDPWAVPSGFDPSALVKGWSLEEVGRLLAPVCEGLLVDAGGDLLVRGRSGAGRAWSVGVRHPLQADALATVLAVHAQPLSGTAVATSGTYARGDHVIDPRSGRPGGRLLSATVVGPDPGLADALATAVFVEGLDGLDRIVALDGFDAFLVDHDRRTWSTPGLRSVAAA